MIIIHHGEIVADDKLSRLRAKSSDKQVIVVSFAENTEASDLQIPGVNRIEQNGPNSFRLFTVDAEKLRRNILQFALDKNLNIVSLQAESQSLETIFKQLTGKTLQG